MTTATPSADLLQRLAACRIGGSTHRADDEGLPLLRPDTEQLLVMLDRAGESSVDLAVQAARDAFLEGRWSRRPVPERQAVLRRIATRIREESESLATLDCLCAGLPAHHLASRQVPRAADNFDFFADVVGRLGGETFEQLPGYLTLVTREPVGVAALLSPWNAPLAMASMQLAACLAFGNSAVIKPSEHAPLGVARLVELIEEAGVPTGVVNLLQGDGDTTGQALVAHPAVDRIALTGRQETARNIMSLAAPHLTPVQFQLGGAGANLVFDDADFERALDGTLVNAFSNAGQLCVAGRRVLVQRGVADRFRERFLERVRRLRVGDPFDAATEIGPLAFEAHYERVLGAIEAACRDGAKLLCGGGRHPDFDRGHFLRPAVLEVSDRDLAICREELLGPVAMFQVFDHEEEAIASANDTPFGLVAYAWTEALGRSLRLQRELAAGTIWINSVLARDLNAPFGGYRQSGIGRDGPRQSAAFFTEEKTTVLPREHRDIPRLGME